jgi:hypothetical protein
LDEKSKALLGLQNVRVHLNPVLNYGSIENETVLVDKQNLVFLFGIKFDQFHKSCELIEKYENDLVVISG